MSMELTLLLWTVALTIVQAAICAVGGIGKVGLVTMAGNRESGPTLDGWVGRANRAHRNMLESLVLFTILVLIGHAVDISTANTVLGAQLFFWARVVYVPVYIIGLPWVRPGSGALERWAW